ncbi:hypothetical protein LCGC14_1243340 [marine sediment metagenome]|uniref:Uncharacterized protein n=1 Tax=marine sediment metagenome TaxID=412755 RepID=A0A0F9L932_9ZZZZ
MSEVNFSSAPPTVAHLIEIGLSRGRINAGPWSTGEPGRKLPVIIPSRKADGYEAGVESSGGSGDPLEVLI